MLLKHNNIILYIYIYIYVYIFHFESNTSPVKLNVHEKLIVTGVGKPFKLVDLPLVVGSERTEVQEIASHQYWQKRGAKVVVYQVTRTRLTPIRL
jgi:hypothetical protein